MPSDKYLSFNYLNTIYSSTIVSLYDSFNGFIVGEIGELKFFNPSSFNHEFITPQFGNQSYFMGTSQENREFEFQIMLMNSTLSNYKNFLRWLNPKNEGKLYFDYNSEWGYDVKVNRISEANFTVNNNCSTPSLATYNIELTVGFITKNDYAATLVATTSSIALPSTYETNYLLTSGTWSASSSVSAVISLARVSGSTYSFYNYTNEDAYLKFSSSALTAFSVTYASELYYAMSSTSALDCTLYTEYGIMLNNTDGSFIPLSTSGGIFILPPSSTTSLQIASTGGTLRIIPVVRELI